MEGAMENKEFHMAELKDLQIDQLLVDEFQWRSTRAEIDDDGAFTDGDGVFVDGCVF